MKEQINTSFSCTPLPDGDQINIKWKYISSKYKIKKKEEKMVAPWLTRVDST